MQTAATSQTLQLVVDVAQVRKVAASEGYQLQLMTTGEVRHVGTGAGLDNPGENSVLVPGLPRCRDIAVLDQACAALDREGRVWCFGVETETGTTGTGAAPGDTVWPPVILAVPYATALFSTGSQVHALTPTGRLWTWGRGWVADFDLQRSAELYGPIHDVASVAGVDNDLTVVTNSGRVYALLLESARAGITATPTLLTETATAAGTRWFRDARGTHLVQGGDTVVDVDWPASRAVLGYGAGGWVTEDESGVAHVAGAADEKVVLGPRGSLAVLGRGGPELLILKRDGAMVGLAGVDGAASISLEPMGLGVYRLPVEWGPASVRVHAGDRLDLPLVLGKAPAVRVEADLGDFAEFAVQIGDVLSGVPGAPGVHDVRVRATMTVGGERSSEVSVRVYVDPAVPVWTTGEDDIPDVTGDASTDFALAASSPGTPVIEYVSTGELPEGFALSLDGRLTGGPLALEAPVTFAVVATAVPAVDGLERVSATRTFSLRPGIRATSVQEVYRTMSPDIPAWFSPQPKMVRFAPEAPFDGSWTLVLGIQRTGAGRAYVQFFTGNSKRAQVLFYFYNTDHFPRIEVQGQDVNAHGGHTSMVADANAPNIAIIRYDHPANTLSIEFSLGMTTVTKVSPPLGVSLEQATCAWLDQGGCGRCSDLYMGEGAPMVPVARGLYAMYRAADYAGDGVWTDASGNGRHAQTNATRVDATDAAYAPTLRGDTSQWALFPAGVLPPTHTLVHVARYAGPARGRIVMATNSKWLSGHYQGRSGTAFWNGAWVGQESDNFHGGDWVVSTTQNRLYRSNGVLRGEAQPDVTRVDLTINGRADQRSDWETTAVIVYDRTLSPGEIAAVERWCAMRVPVVRFPFHQGQYLTSTSYGKWEYDHNGTQTSAIKAKWVDGTWALVKFTERDGVRGSWLPPYASFTMRRSDVPATLARSANERPDVFESFTATGTRTLIDGTSDVATLTVANKNTATWGQFQYFWVDFLSD